MANLDNNMGDFFRKKLNEGSGGENWDRPDAEVRNQLLTDISAKSGGIVLKRYWPAAALILLFCSWGYAANVQYKMKKQSVALSVQQDSLLQQGLLIAKLKTNEQNASACQKVQEKAREEVVQLKKALTAATAIQTDHQKEQEILKRQHQKAVANIQLLQTELTKSQLVLQKIKTELETVQKEKALNNLLDPSLNEINFKEDIESIVEKNSLKSTSDVTSDIGIKVELPQPKFETLSILSAEIPAPKHPLNTRSLSPEPVLKLKRFRPDFELGVQSGFTQMGVNSYRESELQEIISYPFGNNQAYGHKHNLHLAMSVHKNIWIETGLQYSGLSLDQEFDLNLLYEESTEYTLPSGAVANDLELQIYTPYSNRQYQFQMQLPAQNTVDNGDVLLLEASEEINLQRFQIPLGIAYQFGQERLKWRVHAGTAWNMVFTESYGLDLELEAGTDDLEIELESMDIHSGFSQHLSFYTGFSGHYKISKHWQATFGYQAAYNLNEQLLDFNELSTSFNHNLQVGINYQF